MRDFNIRQVTQRGRKVWMLDLRKINQGRRFFDSKRDAEAEADNHLVSLQQEGEAYFDLTPEDRTELRAIKARLAGSGITPSQAVDFALKHLATEQRQLEDAIAECVKAKEASGKRPRYVSEFRYTLSGFARGREKTPCSAVTTKDIESWMNDNDWAPATRSSRMLYVRVFFTWAIKRRYLGINPCDGIEKVSLDDRPPGILGVDQARKLMIQAEHDDAGLIPFLALGLFTGIRPEELKRLTTDEIDLSTALVEIKAHKSKTHRRRLVPMSENCVAWLAIRNEMPVVNLRRRLDRVKKAAGLVSWPHDALRHSFASYHFALHGDAGKTAAVLGHSDSSMLFEHYRALVTPASAKEYFEILPKNMGAMMLRGTDSSAKPGEDNGTNTGQSTWTGQGPISIYHHDDTASQSSASQQDTGAKDDGAAIA